MHPRITLGIVAVLAAISVVVGIAIAPAAPPPGRARPPAADPLAHGLAQLKAGDLTGADAAFRHALLQDPADAVAAFDLGVVLEREGDPDGARTAYQQAITARRDYLPALFNLAVLDTDSDPVTAVKLYRSILAVKPADANSLFNLGLLLINGGATDEGTSLLRQAVAVDPTLAARAPAGVTL